MMKSNMEEIIAIIETMRTHFGWEQSDTQEFLIHALGEEVKELENAATPDELKGELADVLMYAITLAMINNLDVKTIIEEKAKEVMLREY